MTSRTVASVTPRLWVVINLKGGAKRSAATTTMWQTEIHSSHALLSLGCCPMDVEMSSAICSKKNASASIPVSHDLHRQDQIATDEAQKQTMKGEYSIENKQDDEVGSAMTEELNSSVMGVAENRRQPKQEVVLFKDCPSTRSKEKKHRDQDRMESGLTMAFGSGRESDGCEDLRRYFISMGQARRLPSSQHKGVVPQPNGRWGAQIYEKHERVWLGIFNGEEDAARAYDRAAINCRGRDTMSNFIPVGSGDPEARFEREHTKEEILDMLRKHTYDEELELHTKRFMTEARSVAMNNAEASGSEGSVLRAHNENAISSTAAMDGLPRKYLFDKAVTPSDVGKLNRLVIPKQHAEKYFPLDGNSSEKGLLLDFEDKMGKVWRFRYSYWNSSQSYVLTKGWNRFVKDKKLEAGDIVSFHRGSAQPQQLYISWRRRLLGKPQLGVGPHSGQWKGKVVYPVKGLSSLNSFNSGTQATVVDNAQRMSIFWSNSHSVSTLIQEVDHVDAMWSNGALPFYFSTPPTKLTVQSSFYDIKSDGLQPMDLHVNLHNNSSEERKKLTVQSRFYDNKSDGQQPMDWHLNLHNSDNFSEGRIDIKPLDPFVNPARSCAARELETPEQKAESSLDPVTKKGIRLFGVTLDEPQRLSAEHNAQLNLFPS